jgi:hypothetical protein
MRRTTPTILLAAAACAASCTALLDLDDKTFEGGAGGPPSSSGGGGAGAEGGGGAGGDSGGGGGAGGAAPCEDQLPAGDPASTIWARTTESAPALTTTAIRAAAAGRCGETWVAGSVADSASLAGCQVSTTADTAAFWAQLDASGGCLRAAAYGGSSNADAAVVTGMAIDSQGNVVLAGTFTGLLQTTEGSMNGSGPGDLFVIKLDPAGGVVWQQRFGGAQYDEAHGVAVDSQDNIVVAGGYVGSFDIGATPLQAFGGSDVLLLKLAPNTGAPLWALGFGSAGSDLGRAVAVDPVTNRIGITGSLAGSATCVDKSISTSNPGVFAAVVDPGGAACPYATSTSTSSVSSGQAAAFDVSGANLVLGGDFTGTLRMDSSLPDTTAGGDLDGFLASLNIAGLPDRIERLGQTVSDGSAYHDHIFALAPTGPTNELVAGGVIQGSAAFLATAAESAGGDDAVVVKVSAGLTANAWLRVLGGDGDQSVSAVAVDPSTGAVIAAGTFDGTIDLGGGSPFTARANTREAFVVKLRP